MLVDARIASLGAALILIVLIGVAIQLGGEEAQTTGTQAPVTGTVTRTTTSPATSGEDTETSEPVGEPWITTTVTTEAGTTTTTTLTRTGPTTSPEEVQVPSQDAGTTTTTTITTTTTTEMPEEGGPGQTTIIPGEPEPETPSPVEAVKVKVDKTVKAREGWVTVKTVTLKLDEREGMLTVNVSLALPDPCWKAKANIEVEGPVATITVNTERNPSAICIQMISDTTLTLTTPADTIPSKIEIVVVIGGEAYTITVDVNESYQPKQAP